MNSFSSSRGADSRNSSGRSHPVDLTRFFFRCLFDSQPEKLWHCCHDSHFLAKIRSERVFFCESSQRIKLISLSGAKSEVYSNRSLPTRSFAEASKQFLRLSCPIGRQDALLNIPVETAERPIGDSRHEPVLHGVVMDVIDVPLKIGVVADRMLPVPALPDAFPVSLFC